MKFQRTPQFVSDYKADDAIKEEWDYAFPNIIRALTGDQEQYRHFRIKKMEGWPGRQGIWEGHIKINLVFTFHHEKLPSGENSIFFRRLGTHEVYKKP